MSIASKYHVKLGIHRSVEVATLQAAKHHFLVYAKGFAL